jgi:phosphate uptake regulator
MLSENKPEAEVVGDTEVVEEPVAVHVEANELSSILDEAVVDALAGNGITTKDQLKEFIATGKELTELNKIGQSRANKILAALANG